MNSFDWVNGPRKSVVYQMFIMLVLRSVSFVLMEYAENLDEG